MQNGEKCLNWKTSKTLNLCEKMLTFLQKRLKDNNVLGWLVSSKDTGDICVSPRAWGRLGCSHIVVSAMGGTVVTLHPASSVSKNILEQIRIK